MSWNRLTKEHEGSKVAQKLWTLIVVTVRAPYTRFFQETRESEDRKMYKILLAASLAAAMALFGCGHVDDDDVGGAAGDTPAASAPDVASSAPASTESS